MRNKHTSPFEQPALVFEVKAPIFVFREWHRHRTPKLNEMSARYTVMPNEYYVPDINRIQKQSTTNKQGSGEPFNLDDQIVVHRVIDTIQGDSFESYIDLIDDGVAKELARVILPVGTYSKMVWQCDLHNLLNFLRLRMAPTAQHEIRAYANEIGRIVETAFPKTWTAFDEHVLGAVTFSKSEFQKLRHDYGYGHDISELIEKKVK
jgi:thymidylate synthase (FAD)